jgi:hypothetical protein
VGIEKGGLWLDGNVGCVNVSHKRRKKDEE